LLARRGTPELGAVGLFKAGELIFRQSHKEGLQQDDRFAEAGVKVEMAGIESIPEGWGVGGWAFGELDGGL
jgi:hypothetical protein